MDWLDEVRDKVKRGNQILFVKDGEFLHELALLVQEQHRRALALWALELAEETVEKLLEKYPAEHRPKEALLASRAWAAGTVKMPVAQRAILQVHALAKELSSPEDKALCHAVGQACGVVHTPGHAMGFPMYELTALVRQHGLSACREPVEQRKEYYIERLHYWHEHYQDYSGTWAAFMLADS